MEEISIRSTLPLIRILERIQKKRDEHCDTHILCRDGFIPVHRYVLMANSPFLNTIIMDILNNACNCQCDQKISLNFPTFKVEHMVHVVAMFYGGMTVCKLPDLFYVTEILKDIGINFGNNDRELVRKNQVPRFFRPKFYIDPDSESDEDKESISERYTTNAFVAVVPKLDSETPSPACPSSRIRTRQADKQEDLTIENNKPQDALPKTRRRRRRPRLTMPRTRQHTLRSQKQDAEVKIETNDEKRNISGGIFVEEHGNSEISEKASNAANLYGLQLDSHAPYTIPRDAGENQVSEEYIVVENGPTQFMIDTDYETGEPMGQSCSHSIRSNQLRMKSYESTVIGEKNDEEPTMSKMMKIKEEM